MKGRAVILLNWSIYVSWEGEQHSSSLRLSNIVLASPLLLNLPHPQRMGLPDRHCFVVAAELSVSCLMSASVHAWLLIFIYFHQLLFSTMNKMQLISVLYVKREKRIENFNTEEQGQWNIVFSISRKGDMFVLQQKGKKSTCWN